MHCIFWFHSTSRETWDQEPSNHTEVGASPSASLPMMLHKRAKQQGQAAHCSSVDSSLQAWSHHGTDDRLQPVKTHGFFHFETFGWIAEGRRYCLGLEFSKNVETSHSAHWKPMNWEPPLWNQRSDCSGLGISLWRLNQSEEASAQLSIAGTRTSHSTEKLRVWYFE